MHAIGHYILEHDPSRKVMYISSEKFTNEFINAIRDNRGENFRINTVTSTCCLLMIFSFWREKTGRRKSFSIHSMPCMRNVSKSSSPATARQKKFQRWKSVCDPALNGGLSPTFKRRISETRIAILRKKAKAENLDIPNEAMAYIATRLIRIFVSSKAH